MISFVIGDHASPHMDGRAGDMAVQIGPSTNGQKVFRLVKADQELTSVKVKEGPEGYR